MRISSPTTAPEFAALTGWALEHGRSLVGDWDAMSVRDAVLFISLDALTGGHRYLVRGATVLELAPWATAGAAYDSLVQNETAAG